MGDIHRVSDAVARHAAAHGGRTAVVCARYGETTRAELAARIRELAASLRAVGVKPGDKVGVMLPRCAAARTRAVRCLGTSAAWAHIRNASGAGARCLPQPARGSQSISTSARPLAIAALDGVALSAARAPA